MRGKTEIKINQRTMVEAMQQYFDRQFVEGSRMLVSEVKTDPSAQYSGGGEFVAFLSEPGDGDILPPMTTDERSLPSSPR
jgi:hypothetical protein